MASLPKGCPKDMLEYLNVQMQIPLKEALAFRFSVREKPAVVRET